MKYKIMIIEDDPDIAELVSVGASTENAPVRDSSDFRKQKRRFGFPKNSAISSTNTI